LAHSLREARELGILFRSNLELREKALKRAVRSGALDVHADGVRDLQSQELPIEVWAKLQNEIYLALQINEEPGLEEHLRSVLPLPIQRHCEQIEAQ